MTDRKGACARRIAVALMVASSLALAACGDDDDGGGGGDGDSAKAQTITIKATGTEKDLALDVTPKSAKPGAATIAFENAMDKGGSDGQLVFLAEEHTDKEVAAEFAKAVRGKPVAAWFQAAGGPCCADKPGAKTSVRQDLKAGTYVVLPGEEAQLPLTRFEVKGDAGDEFEGPAAKVSATEYAFKGEGVKSGEPVLLENAGGTWHHFIASRLKPDATIADAKKFLATEKGEPPFAEETGLESTVLDAGVSQAIAFKGKPGKYAFFCFVSDKKGGPPHVAKGMVSEVVVE